MRNADYDEAVNLLLHIEFHRTKICEAHSSRVCHETAMTRVQQKARRATISILFQYYNINQIICSLFVVRMNELINKLITCIANDTRSMLAYADSRHRKCSFGYKVKGKS